MLSVKAKSKAQFRTSERQFESMFVEALKRKGIFSRHMSDRNAGLPDRYLAGGTWVELKSLLCPQRGLPAGYGLSPEQKRSMAELHDAGDYVYYLALILLPCGKKVCVLEHVTGALDDRIIHPVTTLESLKVETSTMIVRPYTQEGLDKIINRIVPF